MVDKAGVRFAVVNGLRMLGNYDAVDALRNGDKVAYMTIGQAGERSWAPPRSPARIVSSGRRATAAAAAWAP